MNKRFKDAQKSIEKIGFSIVEFNESSLLISLGYRGKTVRFWPNDDIPGREWFFGSAPIKVGRGLGNLIIRLKDLKKTLKKKKSKQ